MYTSTRSAASSGYELGFVFLPGWLVCRALISPVGGRLRQIALGWSLGYLLEVFAFFVAAALGVRPLFYAYPLVVVIPLGLVAWRRRVSSAPLAESPARATRALSTASISTGVILWVLLLPYTATIGFAQNPLPRDLGSATYQEDTVFTISIAAEALHHWPVTLPMVAGQLPHYHLFAYMHMAAISQVTGIDLSVVVMRLYEVPLLLLLALQLLLAGRRIGRGSCVGLAAVALVLFFGELDAARTGVRFLFDDFFFYWLLASHTFLLGLIFFLSALLILSDLVTPGKGSRRSRVGFWILLGSSSWAASAQSPTGSSFWGQASSSSSPCSSGENESWIGRRCSPLRSSVQLTQ